MTSNNSSSEGRNSSSNVRSSSSTTRSTSTYRPSSSSTRPSGGFSGGSSSGGGETPPVNPGETPSANPFYETYFNFRTNNNTDYNSLLYGYNGTEFKTFTFETFTVPYIFCIFKIYFNN